MQKPPSLQDSKIASLKDPLQNVNEKLKAQEVPKTKDYNTNVTRPNPLYPPLPGESVYESSI